MVRKTFSTAILLAALCLFSGRDIAAQDLPEHRAQPASPRPEQDDSTLRSVAFASPQQVWAVGDRGVVWKSMDGGNSWQFQAVTPTLEKTTLTRVRFLTDRTGWICGSAHTPAGGSLSGILLSTTDGGLTWVIRNRDILPPLHDVRFFDLDRGVAIGSPSPRFPTGVLRTTDGGQTWTPLAHAESHAWQAAAFFTEEHGVVVGGEGRFANIAGETLLPGGNGLSGLRSLNAVSASTNGQGWLAGDGGLLLRSQNLGVSWQPAPQPLPESLSDFTDFQTIVHRNQQVWAAGSPGSIVWHSSDAGQTWRKQPTGGPAPLLAVEFLDEQHGVAVGVLGRICVTDNGGAEWRSPRGGDRRLACLVIGTDPARVPLEFLTRWSREDGYRAAYSLAVRRDLGPDAFAVEEQRWRLSQAVATAGGTFTEVDWRLPLAVPSLESNREKLMAEWGRLTDRRMKDIMLSRFVAQLRTWQPSSVLLEEPKELDFAALTIQQAVLAAVKLASDPESFPEHLADAGLDAWAVRKVMLQRPPGPQGTVSQDPVEILPHLQTTLDACLAQATSVLAANTSNSAMRTQFVVPYRREETLSERTLLHDLDLPVGGPARRQLTRVEEFDYERLANQVRHRQHVASIARSLGTQAGRGEQLLGQISEIVRPLTPEQAARQLAELAALYQASGNWTAAEETSLELVRLYPQQPAAVDAMLWLVTYWSSAELNWQRLRTYAVSQTVSRPGALPPADATLGQLEKAIQSARDAQQNTQRAGWGVELTAPVDRVSASPVVMSGNLESVVTANGQGVSPQDQLRSRWETQATTVLKGMEQNHPELRDDPRLQFIAAALARRRNQPRQADEIYRSFFQGQGNNPWQIAAKGEIYLLRPGAQSPKPVALCRRASAPPVLDGLLSDTCWTDAAEIRLENAPLAANYVGTRAADVAQNGLVESRPIVMFTYDNAYFYLAASVPIDETLIADEPLLPGRTHDAALERHDRLAFQFDIDRDYATFYEFQVDQRGMTREALWNNASYNPRWHCAAVRDPASWRVECAIPLEELLPGGIPAHSVWGMGIVRIKPGVGVDTWTNSGGNTPHPPLFGLLQF